MERNLRILQNPRIEDAFKLVRDGISAHRNVVIVGNCQADYSGRASSNLAYGERIVIIKSDGSTLIHRPRDYAPVNWQPPGSLFRTSTKDEHLIIHVYRRKERESLELRFDSVYLAFTLKLVDTAEFTLYASEEEMREAILLEPSLIEEGFRPAAIERPVPSGFIDVLGVDREARLIIVEVKRKVAGREAVDQLKRYIEDLKKTTGQEIRGILASPEISRGVQTQLAKLRLEHKPISPKRCSEILASRRERKLNEYQD